MERTLTVCSRWGLCNRLRVLLSGIALAEASGRRFTMLWPRACAFGATFQEVFTNDINVVEGDLPEDTPIYGLLLGGPQWPNFLTMPDEHVVALSGAWLVRPELYPEHKALQLTCAQLLDTLQPVPLVRERVAAFKSARFRPAMIGVHLRRGDFSYSDGKYNTSEAVEHVDAFLAQNPQAGILLCSDDGAPDPHSSRLASPEGVHDKFVRRYGDRVVFTEPRSLNRHTVEAAQDALVDFLLLRSVDYLVGTRRSSFSRVAAFGRTIPTVMCGSVDIGDGRIGMLPVVTGAYPLLKALGYVEFRRNVPYSQLAGYYRWRISRLWRRLPHRHTG